MDAHDELEQLRARVAHLESLVERLAADSTGARRDARPRPEPPERSGLDRRRMLRNGLGLSAVAVAGVGLIDALGSTAAAADGDAVTVAQTVSPTSASSDPTRITNPSTTTHANALFQVDNVTDDTVALPSNTKAALLATFAGHEAPPVDGVAVLGLSGFGTGVEGRSDGYRGVSGWSLGVGVHGRAQASEVSAWRVSPRPAPG